MIWKKIFLFVWHIPRNICIGCITIYQKTLSPDHGWFKSMFPYGYCKFHPTCSNYGIQSLKKHGFIKGFFKTIWRILRCNPWNTGGEDQP